MTANQDMGELHSVPKSCPLLQVHGTSIREKYEWKSMEKDKLFFDPV